MGAAVRQSGGRANRRGRARTRPMSEINVTPFVDVMLVLNQPVNPSSQNINNDRVRLEFMLSSGPDVWQDFPADVILERNCTATGAEIRLIPLGPFPQDRPMRIVIEPEPEACRLLPEDLVEQIARLALAARDALQHRVHGCA